MSKKEFEKGIKIRCDRCHKVVEGHWWSCKDGKLTMGYYDLSDPYWKQFSISKEEKNICEKCMQSSKKYRRIYGLSTVSK